MTLSHLLEEVPQQWHRAFVHFVETGEAEQPFLDYLDHDDRGQRAIEKAFSAQAEALQDLGVALRDTARTGQGIAIGPPQRSETSRAIADAFEQILDLSTDDRRSALAEAAAAIAQVRDGRRAKKLQVAVSDFQQVVEKTAG